MVTVSADVWYFIQHDLRASGASGGAGVAPELICGVSEIEIKGVIVSSN